MSEKIKQEIDRALDFAYNAHKGIFRKDDITPYIIHPLDVLRKLQTWGWNDDIVVFQVALLHDVVEDTPVSLETIRENFGEEVANIVNDLTFRDKRDDESSQEYQSEKSEHLTQFKDKPIISLIVKLADRICNIDDFLRSKNIRYALKYYRRASGLFQAVKDRKEEIIQEIGELKYLAMEFECNLLEKEMSRFNSILSGQ